MGGREPQIHKLWIFSEDGITCEVHPLARITVGDFSRDCFHTNYATEIGRRVAIYVRKFINGSVDCLGIPAPFCDTGVAWTDNILFPSPRCGDRFRVGDWGWETQPGFLIGADDPWRSVVPDRPAYLPRSPPENARATVFHVCDTRLWENPLAWAQISCTPTTLAVMSGLIGLMATGMIFGTNRLINNFCVKLPLVV